MRARTREAVAVGADVADPRSVGLISLSHGVNEFYSVVIPPIIPLLVADFEITYAGAGFLLTVFFVMYSVFQLPAGLLADRVGKTRLLVGGLAAMAGGVLLAAAAPGYDALVAAQVAAGIGGSTYHPTGMSLISDVETGGTEGTAMGVFGLGGVAGTACAPLVIGGLASVFGWRVALAAAAGVGAAATLLLLATLEEPDDPDGPDAPDRPDGPAGSDGPDDPDDSDDTAGPDGSGAAGDAASGEPAARPDGGDRLPARARRTVERLLRFRLTPTVALLVAATLLGSLQIRAVITFTTSFLFESFGQSNSRANAVFFVMLAAGGASSLWIGRLADRFDRGRIGAVAAVATAALLFASAAVAGRFAGDPAGTAARTGLLLGLFAPLGFAVYGITPVKNAMISEYADAEFSGGLFGVTQTASAVGSAAGPSLVGYLAAARGMEVAFPAIGGVSLAIAAVFLALSRSAGRSGDSQGEKDADPTGG